MKRLKNKQLELVPLFEKQHNNNLRMCYCPICEYRFLECPEIHLSSKDEKQVWFLNMMDHYRYSHLESWVKKWGRKGNRITKKKLRQFNKEKKEVDERSKRQILRKCEQFLHLHRFLLKDFQKIGGNEETVTLAMATLPAEIIQTTLEL